MIGAFAKAAGVTVEAIRSIQPKGMPDSPYGSIRRYAGMDMALVKFVKSAQRPRFSFDEIAALLKPEGAALQ